MLSSARIEGDGGAPPVLAGGRGSQLHQLTDRRAKPPCFSAKFRIIDFLVELSQLEHPRIAV
jgi:ADP-glucose pyrophosphorylase